MTEYTMTVYADPNGPVGHFFVGVAGPNINMPVSGKYMRDEAYKNVAKSIFGVPGKISDDRDHTNGEGVIRKDFPLNKEQAEKAAAYIKNARENPGEYELFGHNCISFAQGALDAAEVKTRVDKAFSAEELDAMGNPVYGAGDEAQRRGRIIDVDKEIKDFRDSENSPFGPHADVGGKANDKADGEPVEIADAGVGDAGADKPDNAPKGTGLAAEAARSATEVKDLIQPDVAPVASPDQSDMGSTVDSSDSGPSEESRAKAMAIIAQGLDGKDDDLDTLMLKPVDLLTDAEAKKLGDWSWQLRSQDPRRSEIENRRRDYFVLNYGEEPAAHDATGRMIEPEAKRTIPQQPSPLKSPNGELVAEGLKRFAENLAPAIDDEGETPVVRAVQSGLGLLGEKLKIDGDAGVKTKAALTRVLAKQGAGKAEEAFGLGRFQQFAEAERSRGGSASDLKSTVAKTVQPLFGPTKPTVAAEALQESLNDLSVKTAAERQKPAPQPLKIDGDIGPLTTDAFRLALVEHGPEKLTRSFHQSLGFGDGD